MSNYSIFINKNLSNLNDMIKRQKESYYLYKQVDGDKVTTKKLLQELVNLCKFARNNNSNKLRIYYTGSSQKKTGNWCMRDGFITFEQIINTIIKYWGNQNFSIYCDCCYSGNWVQQLIKYKNELSWVFIEGATIPNCIAYYAQNGDGSY